MNATLRSRLWRLLPWLLALTVLWLVVREARRMDWAAVWDALRAQAPLQLLAAAALALASHAILASYDLIARAVTRHGLAASRTLLIATTSYAFNLNFGALVGGLALRLRLYTREGLPAATVARIIGYSLASNWLGYLLVGGAVMLLAPPVPPGGWELSRMALRALGAAMLVAAAIYMLGCSFSRLRELRWREHRIELPDARIALLQAALSSINWLLVASIPWMLLDGRIEYPTVLAVMLAAAVAGVITHVPAGLGVLEAVFLLMLSSRAPAPQLLAALLAYRAVYYLLPLLWAVPAYFALEASGRRHPQRRLRAQAHRTLP